MKALVLGARGRMGRHAVTAFRRAGWTVRALVRSPKTETRPTTEDRSDVELRYGDATDPAVVRAAADGVEVIFNALNPPYERWAAELPRLTASVIEAARATGVTVLLPGNVYNYGEGMPAVLTEDTPHRPTTRKGRLRQTMEDAYRAAAEDGVQTIILRAGDFIEAKRTGNWFDTYITHRIRDGVLIYPGPRTVEHAWAYLPDLARAFVELAERRRDLQGFESVGFAGHAFTAEDLAAEAEAILGQPVRFRRFPWFWLRLAALFSPSLREVMEMRYLWNVPHRIDGTRLAALLPDFMPTPRSEMLCGAWGAPAPDSALQQADAI